MVNQGGEPFDYDATLTPYLEKINDACDHPDVRVILVKGNTRSGKTVSAESMILRDATYGPVKNVLWFMQDDDSLNDYIDERGEEMLTIHPEVDEKIDWTDRKNGRKRKMVGRALWLWRAATQRALRAKAAPIIVADEIDAYIKKVRDAIMTLITSRQEEFGTAAKAYLCSHPDAGPDGGIDLALKDALVHLWFVRCPHCGGASSPAAEVEEWGGHRLYWNLPSMMGLAEEMDRVDFLNHVAAHVELECPHEGCGASFPPSERLPLMNSGRWLQRHQVWNEDGTVTGEDLVQPWMGFVIHAFMAPFVKLPETARDWAAAMLSYQNTGQDTHLREVVVKKLGETPSASKPEEQMENAKVVAARLTSNYDMRKVPAGVKFLTAFVDIQGDRFEVRVIGWDLARQSWLIDAFQIKNWPADEAHGAFDNIDPGNRVGDFDVLLKSVINAHYPLASNEERVSAGLEPLFMPIAKTVLNSAGQPGAQHNARLFASKAYGSYGIPMYKLMLMIGAATAKGELYGKPKQITHDEQGRPLHVPVYERAVNVHDLKRLITLRMKIETPGPGRIHFPSNISPRYFQELTAEHMVNGKWVQRYARNETFDGFVACEVARETLGADNREIDWSNPPVWAKPKPRGQGEEAVLSPRETALDRLLKLNSGV